MRLRYQMRGLGIGMIVTALLMGFAVREKIPLSDAEIRAKALELGMVESDSLKLTDIQNVQPSSTPETALSEGEGTELEKAAFSGENDREEGESVSGEGQGEDIIGSEGGDGASGENGGIQGQDSSESSGESAGFHGQENSHEQQPGAAVTFVIESGMDSYSICQMLAQIGLVEDADTFDTYINELGYSRSVRAGNYEIPIGTDAEEIAKIITGNR